LVVSRETKAGSLLGFRLALGAGFCFDLDFDFLGITIDTSRFPAVRAVVNLVVDAMVESSAAVAVAATFEVLRAREEALEVPEAGIEAPSGLVLVAEIVMSLHRRAVLGAFPIVTTGVMAVLEAVAVLALSASIAVYARNTLEKPRP